MGAAVGSARVGKGRAVVAAAAVGWGGATGVLLAQAPLKTIGRTKAVKAKAKARLRDNRSGWGGRIPNKRFSIDRPRPNSHPDLM